MTQKGYELISDVKWCRYFISTKKPENLYQLTNKELYNLIGQLFELKKDVQDSINFYRSLQQGRTAIDQKNNRMIKSKRRF